MNENSTLKSRFNTEGTRSFWEWRVHDRVADAIKRLDARFVLCEPQLTSARYRDLLNTQGHPPALRPFFSKDDPELRMRAAAKQWAQYDHIKRINKIRNVGERMIGKERGLGR